jgi:dTDP-4-amino-4,6-dideoxygalactose transaminase
LVGMGGPKIGLKERIAADKVLKTGALAQGPKVKEFEEAFAQMIGSGQIARAVNSGTSALHLAALSLGLGPGDEVIVPAFTFAASANSIALTGATVRFADVNIETFNIDCDSAKNLVNSNTKAIMFVHLYGNPVGIAEAKAFAEKHGLYLIEDAAQAHGAEFGGIKVGAWGDVAAFSFYPTKNMTTGEGGMVVSRNESLINSVELLRNQGMRVRYQNEVVGFNNRMTEIAAAIGLVQLGRLPALNNIRTLRASRYGQALDSNAAVIAPKLHSDSVHVFHQYTLRIPNGNRDSIADKLRQQGVDSAIYYPTPLPYLKPYQSSSSAPHVPVSDALCKEVLSLPINPSITARGAKRVVRALRGL